MGKKLRQAVGKNTDIKSGFSTESSLCGPLPTCRVNTNCMSDNCNRISQNLACWGRKVPGLPGKYFHRPTWIIQETPGNSPSPEREIYGCFSMRAFEKWTVSLISQCQTMCGAHEARVLSAGRTQHQAIGSGLLLRHQNGPIHSSIMAHPKYNKKRPSALQLKSDLHPF